MASDKIINKAKTNLNLMRKGNNNTTDEGIAWRVSLKSSKFEYAGGWINQDSYFYLRCKDCGNIVKHSGIILKPSKPFNVSCKICNKIYKQHRKKVAAEQREKKRRAKAEDSFYGHFKTQEKFKCCPVCNSLFVGRNKYCSTRCANKVHYSTSKDKRLRRIKQATIDYTITLKELYERDKGICWICGRECDYEADSNSNYYPSIDHVIPLSRGGVHSWENVKLAHRICNSIKRNKEYPTSEK